MGSCASCMSRADTALDKHGNEFATTPARIAPQSLVGPPEEMRFGRRTANSGQSGGSPAPQLPHLFDLEYGGVSRGHHANQDVFVVLPDLESGVVMASVFDGHGAHGGKQAADMAAESLPGLLRQEIRKWKHFGGHQQQHHSGSRAAEAVTTVEGGQDTVAAGLRTVESNGAAVASPASGSSATAGAGPTTTAAAFSPISPTARLPASASMSASALTVPPTIAPVPVCTLEPERASPLHMAANHAAGTDPLRRPNDAPGTAAPNSSPLSIRTPDPYSPASSPTTDLQEEVDCTPIPVDEDELRKAGLQPPTPTVLRSTRLRRPRSQSAHHQTPRSSITRKRSSSHGESGPRPPPSPAPAVNPAEGAEPHDPAAPPARPPRPSRSGVSATTVHNTARPIAAPRSHSETLPIPPSRMAAKADTTNSASTDGGSIRPVDPLVVPAARIPSTKSDGSTADEGGGITPSISIRWDDSEGNLPDSPGSKADRSLASAPRTSPTRGHHTPASRQHHSGTNVPSPLSRPSRRAELVQVNRVMSEPASLFRATEAAPTVPNASRGPVLATYGVDGSPDAVPAPPVEAVLPSEEPDASTTARSGSHHEDSEFTGRSLAAPSSETRPASSPASPNPARSTPAAATGDGGGGSNSHDGDGNRSDGHGGPPPGSSWREAHRAALVRSFLAYQKSCTDAYDEAMEGPLRELQSVMEGTLGGRRQSMSICLPHEGGTTATTVMLQQHMMSVGWVGDSRMVLARRHPATGGFTPLFATKDHTCLNPREVSRVTNAGGTLAARHFGVEGADGLVAVSRSLGDVAFHAGDAVSCVPDVLSAQLSPLNDYLIVIGSDGLWDTLTVSDVLDLAAAVARQVNATPAGSSAPSRAQSRKTSIASPYDPSLAETDSDTKDIDGEPRQRSTSGGAAVGSGSPAGPISSFRRHSDDVRRQPFSVISSAANAPPSGTSSTLAVASPAVGRMRTDSVAAAASAAASASANARRTHASQPQRRASRHASSHPSRLPSVPAQAPLSVEPAIANEWNFPMLLADNLERTAHLLAVRRHIKTDDITAVVLYLYGTAAEST